MRSLPPTLWVPFNTLILVCLYHYVLVCHGQRYVNIALLKTCKQSSTYGSAFKASNAVDNNLYTLSHTDNRTREWWEVDLGRNYHIKDIRIYPPHLLYSRVANTTIKVDSRVCARVPQNDAAVVNVSCENFTNGRIVRITKDDNASERFLSIAEFQVLGCQQGYYGDTCRQSCLSSYCQNNECDRLSGQCITCRSNYKAPECIACDRGKYGEDCKYDCGSCANSQDCDKINGSCLKCVPGKKLPYCELACDHGKYGVDCKHDCGSCADSQDCDKINGSCQKCVPGKKLPYCISSCDPGHYGENCSKKCGHCLNDEPCNATGHCKQCKPGLQTPLCQEDCETGKYGQDCLQECGHCAGNAACKVTTGHCPSCTPGLNPPLCKEGPVSFDVVIISGAIIGGFLILAISISVPLWLKRSKHRTVEESNRKQVQLQTSFNRRHLQAQAQLPNLLETGADYDDLGNPYDTLDISVLDDGVKYTQPVFTKINTSTVNDTTN